MRLGIGFRINIEKTLRPGGRLGRRLRLGMKLRMSLGMRLRLIKETKNENEPKDESAIETG